MLKLALTVRTAAEKLISRYALFLQGEQYEVILWSLCTKNKAKNWRIMRKLFVLISFRK